MIKVLHLTYDMRIGGTEMVIKNLIIGNADPNVSMSIYCIEAPIGPWGCELQNNGTQITVHERRPRLDFSLIKSLRKHIKQNEIDVIHCHQYTPWVYGALAAAFTKTKVLFTEHGRFYPDVSSFKRRLINPILLSLTSSCTAISKATSKALCKYEFFPSAKVKVIYNGVTPLKPDLKACDELKKKYCIAEYDFIFGTVARLDPIKNQTMMIQAFAEVLKKIPNALLIIVGDGEEKEKLHSLVDELAINKSVVFTGFVPNPVNHIQIMDVFLLSSFSEGTSMTLLEAMSLGKPCVVTDAGGNKEIISHSQTGFVVENGNAEEFALEMYRMFENRKLYLEMRANASDDFKSRFDETIMQANYNEIYKKIT